MTHIPLAHAYRSAPSRYRRDDYTTATVTNPYQSRSYVFTVALSRQSAVTRVHARTRTRAEIILVQWELSRQYATVRDGRYPAQC